MNHLIQEKLPLFSVGSKRKTQQQPEGVEALRCLVETLIVGAVLAMGLFMEFKPYAREDSIYDRFR